MFLIVSLNLGHPNTRRGNSAAACQKQPSLHVLKYTCLRLDQAIVVNCACTIRYFTIKKAPLYAGFKKRCTWNHNICLIGFLSSLLLFSQYTLAIRKLLTERDNLGFFHRPIIIASPHENSAWFSSHRKQHFFRWNTLRDNSMTLSSDCRCVVHNFSSYPFSEKRIQSTLKVRFIRKNSLLDWHDGNPFETR